MSFLLSSSYNYQILLQYLKIYVTYLEFSLLKLSILKGQYIMITLDIATNEYFYVLLSMINCNKIDKLTVTL